jgi:dTDP-L-rhamnose 4-epimerase
MGTAQLLEVLARCTSRPRHIFLASSRSVYGEGAYRDPRSPEKIIQPRPRGFDALTQDQWDIKGEDGAILEPVATPESLSYLPGSVYAATKAAQELLLLSASEGLNAKTVVFRFQNVYGEGQSLRNPYTGIISIFFNKARQGLEIPIYEDGSPTRDFIHVNDIALALANALEADLSHGSVVNLGAGYPTKINDLAFMLSQEAGFDVPIRVTGQYRLGDIRNNWADITQAQKLLNFVPQISLVEGIRRFVLWAKNEPVYDDLSFRATKELQTKGLTN